MRKILKCKYLKKVLIMKIKNLKIEFIILRKNKKLFNLKEIIMHMQLRNIKKKMKIIKKL